MGVRTPVQLHVHTKIDPIFQNKIYFAKIGSIFFVRTGVRTDVRMYGCTRTPVRTPIRATVRTPVRPPVRPPVHTPNPGVHWPEQILAYVILRVLEIS